MYTLIPIDVTVFDVAIDHITIDVDVPIARIHIHVGNVDVRRRPSTPATGVPVVRAIPAVVVDRPRTPVAVVGQPTTDWKADAERPEVAGVAEAVDRARIHDVRVIHRHVDHARIHRRDHVVVIVMHDVLLRRRLQVTLPVGHSAHALHRRHHVTRLAGVRATERGGPVVLVRHHVERRRIVRHRLHADIPRLVVDVGRAVGADEPRGFLDLVREGRGHQHLSQQRVWIERNRADEVVELVRGVPLEIVWIRCLRPALLRGGDGGLHTRHQRGDGEQRERLADHGATPGRDRNGPVAGHESITHTGGDRVAL